MFLVNKFRLYRWPLLVISTVLLNAILSIIFYISEDMFSTWKIISLMGAILCIILFNIILFYSGIFNRSDNTFNDRIFKEFTENIEEVFWRATPDLTQTIYVSPAYDEIWGKSRAELFKHPNEWFESILPEDQQKVKNTLLSLTQEDIPNVTFEFRIKRPNGDIRYIYTRGFKFKNSKGQLINILGISSDITNYKNEEQAKIILNNIKHILDHKNHLSVVAPKVLKTICKASSWDFGEIWIVDKEVNVLRSICIWDNTDWDVATEFDNKSHNMTFRPGVAFPGEIWRLGQLIWVDDLDAMELVRMKEAAQAGFHSAVGLPIYMNNHIIGVMDFFSQHIQKPDEISANMLRGISEQLGNYLEKQHKEDQVIHVSRHDAQTSLLNRSAFKDNLKKRLGSSTIKVAILLFEIDRLKLINSVIGYVNSNLLLNLIIDRFRGVVPEPDDQLGRYETNVFACYFSFTLIDEVVQLSHRIINLFNEPFLVHQENLYLSVNIGISTTSDSSNAMDDLFKHANIALDKSIKEGKNNFNIFTANESQYFLEQLTLETSLRHALNNNELCLYYQPKVNLSSGEITGVEALVRWQHPIKGLLLPADFIGLAEETGIIIQLDEWVLREVFKLIKNNWPMNPNGKGLISINISPQHFKVKNDILTYIKSLMYEFNVNPNLIEIEITESVVIDSSRYSWKLLNKLIEMGFNLSLDDFGTGFNSLNYLLRIPVNSVKIDKSFIDGLPDNKNSIAIVRAVITLCHTLGKKVIAEGVETREQAQFLKQEGCDEMQGFYFSPPVPIKELKLLICEQEKMMC